MTDATSLSMSAMNRQAPRPPRSAEESRARIIDAAQAVFSEKGYPHTGLREIAAEAGVAVSLITKHFQTKANLFEQALVAALLPARLFQGERARFGQAIADSITRPEGRIAAPVMLALSLGDAEASAIAAGVTREHILDPMASWLGEEGLARATNALMMTMGFAVLYQRLPLGHSDAIRRQTTRIFAETLQAIVDEA